MNAETHIPNLAERVKHTMDRLLYWREHIETAMGHVYDMYRFDDIVLMVLAQRLDFYEFADCMVLMEVCTFPQWSTYHCFLACGDMQAIKAAEPVISNIAKQKGCQYMSISGRTGWPRALKDDGWEHVMSTLYKEVY